MNDVNSSISHWFYKGLKKKGMDTGFATEGTHEIIRVFRRGKHRLSIPPQARQHQSHEGITKVHGVYIHSQVYVFVYFGQ